MEEFLLSGKIAGFFPKKIRSGTTMEQEFLNLLQDPNTQEPPTYSKGAKKFYGDQGTIQNPAGFAPKFCRDVE